MDRVVIVKKDGVEIARYTIGFSWGDAADKALPATPANTGSLGRV